MVPILPSPSPTIHPSRRHPPNLEMQQQLISRKLPSAVACITTSATTAYPAAENSPPAMDMKLRKGGGGGFCFLAKSSLSGEGMARLMGEHPVPCLLSLSLLFFMGVEYTLRMVPSTSSPVDVGFHLTERLHGVLAASPALNSFLAALNTVFVGMQVAYIAWALLAEGRPRPTIAALFMFTCRGILGYCTQLPLPEGFLGSGVDFPVGNVSFFLFFSGHAGGAVIASLDMRRMGRQRFALAFDALNCLQALRLLATRGHYTIDLAAGIGAGFIFDVLAGTYLTQKANRAAADDQIGRQCGNCNCY